MARTFAFRINSAEFFAALQKIPRRDRGRWVTQLSVDLLTLEPITDYGKQLVAETTDYIAKKTANGQKGGRPKKSGGLNSVNEIKTETKANPNPETETETETELKTTTTDVVVDLELKSAKTLLASWPEAAGAAEAVAAALVVRGEEYAKAQINYAQSNAKSNPSAYLQAALAGDFAGFAAAAEAKAAAKEKKQAAAAAQAARQAAEDALLPPCKPEDCFAVFDRLEG